MSLIEKKGYYKRNFFLGCIILVMTILVATYVGVANISLKQTSLIILNKIPVLGKYIDLGDIKSTSSIIILNVRLPRVIMAAIIGAGLSVSGASFQALFKNPMADPYILGVSSGAALGATIAMLLGLGTTFLGFSFITLAAFLGAITTTLIVYSIARVGNKVPNITLLLAGIAMTFLLSSIISLIMIFKRDQIENIVMWTMGSVSTASWSQVKLLMPFTIVGIIIIFLFSRDLNIMLLGDDTAKNLGIEVDKVRKILLFICTVLVAGIVSVSGIIGFIGLIIPHIVRIIFGVNYRTVILFSALYGSIFLIFCDTIARTIVDPMEIPVGIVTSIFGVPFFMYLLYKAKKKGL
ncbi:MAG: iron ABC transporter permease [Clostridium sp.]|nr:iron ABC transporter permease [Clostridium sp.]